MTTRLVEQEVRRRIIAAAHEAAEDMPQYEGWRGVYHWVDAIPGLSTHALDAWLRSLTREGILEQRRAATGQPLWRAAR